MIWIWFNKLLCKNKNVQTHWNILSHTYFWHLTQARLHNPQCVWFLSKFWLLTFLPMCPWAKDNRTIPGLQRALSLPVIIVRAGTRKQSIQATIFLISWLMWTKAAERRYKLNSLMLVIDWRTKKKKKKRKWRVCHADPGAVCYVQLSASVHLWAFLTPQLCGRDDTILKVVCRKEQGKYRGMVTTTNSILL